MYKLYNKWLGIAEIRTSKLRQFEIAFDYTVI